MLKRFIPLLFPIGMIACSQDSGIEQVSGGSASVAKAESLEPLPFFIFGEDGSRFNKDAESGALLKKELNRSKLVVANEEAFDSLRVEYRSLAENMEGFEYPANYFCQNELLAINTDYSEVVTENGKVLLNDALLLEGCVDISKDDNETSLKKTTTFTDYPQTRTYTKFPVRVFGESYAAPFRKPSPNTGYQYKGISALSVYVYVSGSGYVPYKPSYAKVISVPFRIASCGGTGSAFACEHRKGEAVMSSTGYVEHCDGNISWTYDDMVGVVGKHVVISGQDTIMFRTSYNITESLASRVYSRYLYYNF